MQGQLRQEELSVQIDSTCHHCDRPIQLRISSELEIEAPGLGTDPILTLPLVSIDGLKDPSIIDAF